MASGSKNVSPLQYPTGTPIKGAIAMSNRHNWDAINQHIQDLQGQITTLQTALDALRGASTVAGVSSLQTRTGALTLTSTGASVTITSPTANSINLESSGGSTAPGGSSHNVQYNASGSFAGSGLFMFDPSAGALGIYRTGSSPVGSDPAYGLEVIGSTSDPVAYFEGNNNASITVSNGTAGIKLFESITNGFFTGTTFFDAGLKILNGNTLWIGGTDGWRCQLLNAGDFLVGKSIQPGGLGTAGTYKSQDGTSGLGGNAGSTQAGFTTKDGLVTAYSQSAQSNSSVPGGNTIANTTSPTAFTSTGTVAANTAAVGNVYRLTLYGVYSTAVLAPTLNLSILLGSTVICTSSSITTIGGLTNDGFRAECLVIVTTAGASGVVEAQGHVLYGTAATTALTVMMANTSTVSGIDFTASNNFSAQITWGTASASNTITLRQFVIEKLS